MKSELIVLLFLFGGLASENCEKVPIERSSINLAQYKDAIPIKVTEKSIVKFRLPIPKTVLSFTLFTWNKELSMAMASLDVTLEKVSKTKGEVLAMYGNNAYRDFFCWDGTEGDCTVGGACDTCFPFLNQCQSVTVPFDKEQKYITLGVKRTGNFADFYMGDALFARTALPFSGDTCSDQSRSDIDAVTVSSSERGLEMCLMKE